MIGGMVAADLDAMPRYTILRVTYGGNVTVWEKWAGDYWWGLGEHDRPHEAVEVLRPSAVVTVLYSPVQS